MAIARVLRCVALLAGAVGLSQLSPNGTIPKWRIAYSVFILCCLLLLYPIRILYREDTGTLVERISYHYITLMSPFGIILAIINNLYYRKKFAKAVNALVVTSGQISKLTGSEINIPMVKYSVLMILGLGDLDPWDYVENALVADICLVYIFLPIFYMTVYVFVIDAALVVLRLGFKKDFHSVSQFDVQKLSQYCLLFHEIFCITMKFNKIFSFLILWLIAHATAYIIIGCFFALNFLRPYVEEEEKDVSDVLEPVAVGLPSVRWFSFGVMALWYLIYPFSKISQQNAKFLKTLNDISVRCKKPELIRELQLFSSLILHEKIHFSPHNLFVVGNNIILTVLSASVTYLVILAEVPKSLP